MLISSIPVVFLTPTSFGAVNNGPAIYAQYLWDAFSASDEFDFHLVTPQSGFEHPNIHQSGLHKNSRKQYQELQTLGLEIANSLSVNGQLPVVHGNTAHTMWLFENYTGPVIAQVNDYDAANVFDNPIRTLIDYGPRRLASLIWRKSQEQKAVRFLTRVICNSQYTRQEVLRQYRIDPPEKAEVIYKAVDLKPLKKLMTPKHDFEPSLIGKPRILFVGCNWHRKGLDVLIKAIKDLKERHGQEVKLVVAGKQSQKADKAIRQLPRTLGIENQVQFLGTIERTKLPHLFTSCDLFVLPSRQEALGVAILESLACGIPVVATETGGIPEIIGDSLYCELVPPEDVKKLANAIHKKLEPVETDISHHCQSLAARFSKENMTRSVENLYKSFIKK